MVADPLITISEVVNKLGDCLDKLTDEVIANRVAIEELKHVLGLRESAENSNEGNGSNTRH